MQELIDAAVTAAGRNKLTAAVILVGGPHANGAAPSADVKALETRVAETAAVSARLTHERDAATAQARDLGQRLQAMDKALADANGALQQARAGGAASGADVSALASERDALAREVAALKAKAPTGAPTAQGAPLPAFRDYAIDVLGLDPKVVKGCAKAEIKSIGALHDLAMSGGLKDKLKLTKDEVIAIQERLLGKVPAEVAGATAAPTATGAAPTATSDAPTGHKDQPWLERLGAVRRKASKLPSAKAAVEAAKAALVARWPASRVLDARNEEVTVVPAGLSPGDFPAFFEAAMAYERADKVHGIIDAQIIAWRWGLNIERDPAKAPTIDDALRLSGLVHLMETPPVTGEVAPPTAPPVPQTTAPAGATA